MTGISNGKFSFIEFEAIPQANILIKKQLEKRIEPKVMALLILLASRSGTVVTRGEILEELWPNIVVGDEVISQLIYSLRNALADDAKNPKYIETIPKRGYRFIAEVKITETETKSGLRVKQHSDVLEIKSKINFKLKWLFSNLFLLLLAISIYWFYNNAYLQKSVSSRAIANILPVTQDVGVEDDFSFHEKHNKMVYVRSLEQQVDIYVKTLGTNQPQQITNDDWVESSPLWIDSRTLVYIRKKSGQFQIIRQLLNQDIEIVYESKKAIFNLVKKTNEPDAVTFTEFDDYQHNRLYELKSLNLVSNQVTYLHDSVLNLPGNIGRAIYSLDGDSLYFFDASNDVKHIIALDLQSSQYTTISKQFTWVDHIALLDPDHLLISGEMSATKGVWQLNINDQSIKSVLLSTSGRRIVQAAFKQDQIYYATYKASINQFVADTEHQTVEPLTKLNSDANELSGIYSKDNSIIYFVSNRTGYYEIWSYTIGTQQTEQITQLQANSIYRPVLSHTEKYFAVVYEKESLILSIISLATGKPISENNIPSMKFPLAWSRDDSSIYVSEHIKQVNIYQYDRETLQPKLIQKNAGLFAQESFDEESIILVDYKLGSLITKNLKNETITKLNNSIANIDSLGPGEFKVVEQSTFSVKKHGGKRQIQIAPLGSDEFGSVSKIIMDLPDWSRVTDFNDNGTKAIFFKASPPEGNIMKIQYDK